MRDCDMRGPDILIAIVVLVGFLVSVAVTGYKAYTSHELSAPVATHSHR